MGLNRSPSIFEGKIGMLGFNIRIGSARSLSLLAVCPSASSRSSSMLVMRAPARTLMVMPSMKPSNW